MEASLKIYICVCVCDSCICYVEVKIYLSAIDYMGFYFDMLKHRFDVPFYEEFKNFIEF